MAFNRGKSLISDEVLTAMFSDLYEYQKETVNNCLDKIFDNTVETNIKGQIILPTGAGKTIVAEYLTAKLLNEVYSGYRRPATFGVACHRLILANNLLNRILNTMIKRFNLSNFEIIVVNSGEYNSFVNEFKENYGTEFNVINIRDFDKDVINARINAAHKNNKHVFFVMLYHSLDKVIESNVQFDFVFCDEAHTTIESQFYDKMEKFVKQSEVTLYMTATPTRNTTGKDMTNKEVYGDIIIEKHPRELVFGKHICPINLVIQESFDKNGNVKTRNEMFSSSTKVINSIMTAANSLFNKVEENQINANIPEEERKAGVLFVSVTGNKHLTEMMECNKAIGKKFAAWRENNDVDLYLISAEKGGCIDYSETKGWENLELNKEEFLKRLEQINKTRKNKSIIVFIDMLAEGVDLPDINGVLILRQLDDNAAKIMQIIGRAVRRDDADRKLIKDDSIKFSDYSKFKKPCAYVYLPSVNYTKNESENIINTMLKLYDAYGDIVFNLATREKNDGESIKLIENPSFLEKNNNNENDSNVSYNVKKTKEIIINLLSNIEVSFEEKTKYVKDFFAKHLEKNTVTEEMIEYANKVNNDINLYYDYIKVNYC